MLKTLHIATTKGEVIHSLVFRNCSLKALKLLRIKYEENTKMNEIIVKKTMLLDNASLLFLDTWSQSCVKNY
jgi:hypothetical protein